MPRSDILSELGFYEVSIKGITWKSDLHLFQFLYGLRLTPLRDVTPIPKAIAACFSGSWKKWNEQTSRSIPPKMYSKDSDWKAAIWRNYNLCEFMKRFWWSPAPTSRISRSMSNFYRIIRFSIGVGSITEIFVCITVALSVVGLIYWFHVSEIRAPMAQHLRVTCIRSLSWI